MVFKTKIDKNNLAKACLLLFLGNLLFVLLTGANLVLPVKIAGAFLAAGNFLLIGLMTSYLLVYFFRLEIDFWEMLCLSIPLSFFVPIFSLLLLSKLIPLSSFLSLGVILIFYLFFFLLFRNRRTEKIPEYTIVFNTKKFFKSPLAAVFAIALFYFLIQVLLYKHLPDFDPYKWTYRNKNWFDNNNLGLARNYTLYPALSFFISSLAKCDLFSLYKYIFPFFSALSLIPIWLIAREFKTRLKQWMVLLSFFASPSAMVAYLTPMPQLIWIILFYFFVGFLLISGFKTDKKSHFFFCGAGLMALAGSGYHIGFSIFFSIWLVIAIIKYRRLLVKLDLKTKTLLLIILISNLHLFKYFYVFFRKFSLRAFRGIMDDFYFNISYPIKYTNIDGNQMGWQNLEGVTKFYLYYAGPAFLIALSVCLFLLFDKKNRKTVANFIINRSGLVVLSVCLLFLIFLSEFLPRFSGVAFLPDRIWIFSSILLILIVRIIFFMKLKAEKIFFAIFVFAILINFIGAFYINNSKKYLITGYQFESADWIKNNLPEDRIIYSAGNSNLLRFHSDSKVKGISSSSYYNQEDFDKLFGMSEDSDCSESEVDNLNLALDSMTDKINSSKEKMIKSSSIFKGSAYEKDVEKIISKTVARIKDICKEEEREVGQSSQYVYYAPPDPRNPYINRPYQASSWGFSYEGKFLFDVYTERFERIYDKNGIIIWEIKNQ